MLTEDVIYNHLVRTALCTGVSGQGHQDNGTSISFHPRFPLLTDRSLATCHFAICIHHLPLEETIQSVRMTIIHCLSMLLTLWSLLAVNTNQATPDPSLRCRTFANHVPPLLIPFKVGSRLVQHPVSETTSTCCG